MIIYSLTDISDDTGCCGVFSSEEKATNAALKYIKDWNFGNTEETLWDGFHKTIYYDKGQFEIWKHRLDETD